MGYDLGTGGAGAALFRFYQGTTLGDAACVSHAATILEKCFELVANSTIAQPGLLSGVAGLGWVAHHCFPQTDASFDACLALDKLIKEIGPDDDTDIVSGISGLAIYHSERGNTAALHRLQRSLRARLLRVCMRPAGAEFLGVAHGVAGELLALSIGAHQENLAVVERTVGWLLDQRLTNGFPRRSQQRTCDRYAWCHGTAGIALIIALLSKQWVQPRWAAISRELGLQVGKASLVTAGVVSSGLCHGATGIAVILQRMSEALADPELAETSISWTLRALNMLEEGELTDLSPGLLLGRAGVGLGLLSLLSDRRLGWEKCLALSLST